MFIRQLKQQQYEQLCRYFMRHANAAPFEACYSVSMAINGVEYAVKMQPERYYKIAVLQALRISRGDMDLRYELITSSPLLASFLEILIEQETC